MSRNRHYCKSCGTKKEEFYLWKLRVTSVGIEFWICDYCLHEDDPQLISVKKPSTHYDLDKVLGRK